MGCYGLIDLANDGEEFDDDCDVAALCFDYRCVAEVFASLFLFFGEFYYFDLDVVVNVMWGCVSDEVWR